MIARCPCQGDQYDVVHTFEAPPEGETRLSGNRPYLRRLVRCRNCGHFVSDHSIDLSYQGQYVDATYGDAAGIRKRFEKIIALPPERSDNAGRVARLNELAAKHLPSPSRTVLDVGSGLCVFLHAMKKTGWIGTALDPDPRAARHADEVVGVRGIAADFFEASELGQHDLVTFNKVLEHVREPVAMLARAAAYLKPNGLVYVEVPDGEEAAREGWNRQEFFLEHYHAFSFASASLLAVRAGFVPIVVERLREPSGKYTLRALARAPR